MVSAGSLKDVHVHNKTIQNQYFLFCSSYPLYENDGDEIKIGHTYLIPFMPVHSRPPFA
jgi:hypothetical protein